MTGLICDFAIDKPLVIKMILIATIVIVILVCVVMCYILTKETKEIEQFYERTIPVNRFDKVDAIKARRSHEDASRAGAKPCEDYVSPGAYKLDN